jgi:hypothetical protein
MRVEKFGHTWKTTDSQGAYSFSGDVAHGGWHGRPSITVHVDKNLMAEFGLPCFTEAPREGQRSQRRGVQQR